MAEKIDNDSVGVIQGHAQFSNNPEIIDHESETIIENEKYYEENFSLYNKGVIYVKVF